MARRCRATRNPFKRQRSSNKCGNFCAGTFLLVKANYMYFRAINDGSAGGGSGDYPQNVSRRPCERGNYTWTMRPPDYG